jgi:hypothetical protein
MTDGLTNALMHYSSGADGGTGLNKFLAIYEFLMP